MMLFKEYDKARRKCEKAQAIYQSVIDEQETLFTRTQPNAIRYDKDNVLSSVKGDNLDDYIIEKEKKLIDSKIANAKELVKEREIALDYLQEKLRESKKVADKVYTYKYLDFERVDDISERLQVSKAQIYRIIKFIDRNLEN